LANFFHEILTHFYRSIALCTLICKPITVSNLLQCQTYYSVKPITVSNLLQCQTYYSVRPIGTWSFLSKPRGYYVEHSLFSIIYTNSS